MMVVIKIKWLIFKNLLLFVLTKSVSTAIIDNRLIHGTNVNLGEALQFLREYDHEASEMCYRVTLSQWLYSTNMTDYNKRRMIEQQTLKAKFDKVSWGRAVVFDWTRLPDPMVRKQLKFLITNSRASLSDDKYNEIHHLISEMKDIYSHIRICSYYTTTERLYCDLELEPDIVRIMANSRNPQELLHIWREWHDKIGPPIKNTFMRYTEIANYAARLNGFLDAGEEMRYTYDDDNYEIELQQTWTSLQPLYRELFTYVRRRLVQRYGQAIVRDDGPLPAHLFGNLWAQEWSQIYDIIVPYPEYQKIDATHEMLRQGFTPLRMFQMAEEFYTSLGMKPMPPEFWRYSMLERPNDRKVQCTSSAWDFCNRLDYRIKQCTEVNMDDLMKIHHEMAHIQYYLYYSDQPFLYRDGANPGFHEGISNAISLSIFNPNHLYRVGLYNDNVDLYENNINFLMLMALRKVAFAPFAYLVDIWRYGMFQNGVETMNTDWWELRLRYQGIIPPLPRNDRQFDPGSKRHIIADIPYMKYYIALLLEFQIYNALCLAAGHDGPLHTCDIYRSREAGRILIDILKVGKARHWKDILKMLTRGQSDRLSAEPMLQYFQPLLLWLKVQNKNESVVGWTTSVEDAALFQPYLYGKANKLTNSINIIIVTTVVYFIIN